ncbi:hypothetical protein C206_01747 [Pseudomonas putida TRO1]|uniref:Uncharacterized protein n=2 Tax=Pseudomonas putida TaxID=303 RepID=I3UN65_PSEPU|nr:hypothetical protein [Pseudomonas putida]AFK66936.1 hypothetical protein YSA_00298 [Pseudomonas putida ND6]EMR45926.1 hypothetical protein PPUTLS46_019486 [Pseudomonas putida LS46]ENY79511.1 hypothetical protein C206_01747 [Pseudomonas putida TRO1]MDD2008209.1 hypothetical protein [Pseudomonas putida]
MQKLLMLTESQRQQGEEWKWWQGYLAPSVSSAHLTRQRASVR